MRWFKNHAETGVCAMWDHSDEEWLERILSDHRDKVLAALREVAKGLAAAAGQGSGEPYQMVAMARALDGPMLRWIEKDIYFNKLYDELRGVWAAGLSEFIEQALEVVSLVEKWDATVLRTISFPPIPWRNAEAVRRQFEELRGRRASSEAYSALNQAASALFDLLGHRRGQAGRMQALSGFNGGMVVAADGIETFQILSDELSDPAKLKAYEGASEALFLVITKMDELPGQRLNHQAELRRLTWDALGCLSVNPDARKRSLCRLEEELCGRTRGVCLPSAVAAPS